MNKTLYTILGLSILLLTLSTEVTADDITKLQQQQKKIQEQLQETGKMLNQTKKNETATTTKLSLLNNNIQERKKLIGTINKEIHALDKDILVISNKRQELQTQLHQLREDYARMVRETHYADLSQSPLLFLCAAESFQQLLRRIQYMSEFCAYRKEQVEEIKSVQTNLEIQDGLLKERRGEKATALQAQEREKSNLQRDEKKQKKMLAELKKKEKKLIAQQKQQQKKVDELNKKIESLIMQQTRGKTIMTKEQQLLAGGFEANKGRLPWPVEKGIISGAFGKHQHPVYEHVTVNNKGIYIQTAAGSEARTIFDGEVTSCIVLGQNYAVIVQHGNYRTVYSNLSKLYVKQGEKVTTKQKLGLVLTNTEEDNKTELYFQVYKDRTLLDPSLWICK